MDTICLFDIDGTLLNSGGAGQHAMEQALQEVFGLPGPFQDIPAAGRTDRAITSDLFSAHGLQVDAAGWDRFLTAYLRHLPSSLSAKNGVVLPGIIALLEALGEHPHVSLGLLTGNFEAGAFLKLRHYRLDHHFRFGGYGDDHHDRDDVARCAHAAACQFLSRQVAADKVWVIGDTPSDVRCARSIGAKVVAVATGIFSMIDLEEARPDYLFESLEDVPHLVGLLTR